MTQNFKRVRESWHGDLEGDVWSILCYVTQLWRRRLRSREKCWRRRREGRRSKQRTGAVVGGRSSGYIPKVLFAKPLLRTPLSSLLNMSRNSLNPGLDSFLLKPSPCLAPRLVSICTILRCSLFGRCSLHMRSTMGCFRTKVSAAP